MTFLRGMEFTSSVPLNSRGVCVGVTFNTLLKLDVTRRDHVSVVMDAGSRIVNFIVNFIRDSTVFA